MQRGASVSMTQYSLTAPKATSSKTSWINSSLKQQQQQKNIATFMKAGVIARLLYWTASLSAECNLLNTVSKWEFSESHKTKPTASEQQVQQFRGFFKGTNLMKLFTRGGTFTFKTSKQFHSWQFETVQFAGAGSCLITVFEWMRKTTPLSQVHGASGYLNQQVKTSGTISLKLLQRSSQTSL